MALSLSSLRTLTVADQPPRVLIYGPPGIGKTSLAAEFPSPVFLQLEDGTPNGIRPKGWGRADLPDYEAVISAIDLLYNEDHDFQTVVVDSATEMQKLIFAETCRRGDGTASVKQSIEDFGYGKGYVYAANGWNELLGKLNALRCDRGMTIVLTAHARIKKFDDPETSSYDRYEIDLHEKSGSVVEREMDAILLVKQDVVVKTEQQGFNQKRAVAGGGNRWIHATGKPAFVAKNRYGMPDKMLYQPGAGYAEIAKYLPAGPVGDVAKAA